MKRYPITTPGDRYYQGNVELVHDLDEDGLDFAYIEWKAFQGGSVRIHLDKPQLEQMIKSAIELLADAKDLY